MTHPRLICWHLLLLLLPGALRAGNWTDRNDLLSTPPVQGDVYAEFAPEGSLVTFTVDDMNQIWAFSQETPGAPLTPVTFSIVVDNGPTIIQQSLSGGSDVEVEILKGETYNSLAVIISWLDSSNPLSRLYRFLVGEKRLGGFSFNVMAFELPVGASTPKFNYTFGQLVMAARFTVLGNELRIYRFDSFNLAWTLLASLTGDYRPLGFSASYGTGAFIAYLLLKKRTDGKAYVYEFDVIIGSLSLVGGGAASEDGIGEEGSIRFIYDFAVAGGIRLAILFSDLGAGGKASVRQLSASGQWEYLGQRGFSAGLISCLSLLMVEEYFYVSFRDEGTGNLLRILQIGATGTALWTALLSTPLIAVCGYSLLISSLTRSEPYLYLFFRNANTGLASVLQYDPSAASAIEDASLLGLRLGPVPARETLHLHAEGSLLIRSFELYDAQGRLQRRAALAAPVASQPIPLEGLPAGIYFLRVNEAACLRFSKID